MTSSSRTPASTSFSASRSTAWAGRDCQAAAHVGDDAEFALVIAALGNLEIAVMARGQADAAGGQQIDKRVGVWRHGGVHCVQHLFVLMRSGHRQYLGMCAGDVFGFPRPDNP